jgi:DNA polymerase
MTQPTSQPAGQLAVHRALSPFTALSGPYDAKILLVGEAWGETEAEFGRPFAGASGRELFSMLSEATGHEPALASHCLAAHGYEWLRRREQWLAEASIAMTNVLALRPQGNNLASLCRTKPELKSRGLVPDRPEIIPGKYLHPRYQPELDRLQAEIAAIKPNIVVALGNTACWALANRTNIGSIRGAISPSLYGPKLLPTYHPAAMMRVWSWRPIIIADLIKAWRESKWPEIRRPEREILTSPTIEEVEAWTARTLAKPPRLLANDIETARGFITMMSFAASPQDGIVIPFASLQAPNGCYWPTQAQEERAWACICALLSSPIPKLYQNGMYDLQYEAWRMRLPVRNVAEDSMLLHHSIMPEMLKGLGFLGSIYSQEPAWKLMRLHKADTDKRDE